MILVSANPALLPEERAAFENYVAPRGVFWIEPGSEKETMNSLVEQAHLAKETSLHAERTELKALEQEKEDAFKEKEYLLYFSGMDPQAAMEIFEHLQEAGFEHLLCSLQTEDNTGWSLEQLRAELSREADYMNKRSELASLLEQADMERMVSDKDYRSCMMLGAALLKEDELSEKMLDKALEVIRSFFE